ncbi:hypothetical protein PUN28_018597 [Cardiocondyla obscurior]|uniref:Secreted protein n=1 Tax=Cardiocondyla obscurior TaxID=286306 RepID=A0AAW2EHC4_9HYME
MKLSSIFSCVFIISSNIFHKKSDREEKSKRKKRKKKKKKKKIGWPTRRATPQIICRVNQASRVAVRRWYTYEISPFDAQLQRRRFFIRSSFTAKDAYHRNLKSTSFGKERERERQVGFYTNAHGRLIKMVVPERRRLSTDL